MTTTRTATGLLATAIAILALPGAAAAEYLVPPSNSAATQYTETVPTAGGHRDSEKGRQRDRSPAAVLGSRNARKLEQQGEEGQRVAEVVAATAPSPEVEPEPVAPAEPVVPAEGGEPDEGDRRAEGEDTEAVVRGGGSGAPPAAGPSGSSGLSEVLAQATGVSSSGQLGLLLPLAIAGVAAWALAFLLRQRGRPTS